MLKYALAGLIVLSTVLLPSAANAQGFFTNPYYGGGTFIDRLVGNGGYRGYAYSPYNTGYYPGNSWYGHHHHHHCGGYYGYRGGGRRWF